MGYIYDEKEDRLGYTTRRKISRLERSEEQGTNNICKTEVNERERERERAGSKETYVGLHPESALRSNS